jgi:hypothetical protein
MCLPICDERGVKVGGLERNLLGKSIFASKIFRSIFMYRGYIVDEDFECDFEYIVENYSSLIEEWEEEYNNKLNNNIKSFKDEDGYLRADVIQANWFPSIDADVFISHSHNDLELAIAFSLWLEDSFGISSFVDSCVWGCAYELLKLINNEYNLNKRSQLYKYEGCMYAASHVYMILSRALASMIDRTECLFFLSTSNSLRSQYKKEVLGRKVAKTASPWIYSEIEMTRLIGKKDIEKQRRQREQRRRREQDKIYSADPLRANYPIKTKHLTKIGWEQLSSWEEDWRKGGNSKQERPASKALDLLYARTK